MSGLKVCPFEFPGHGPPPVGSLSAGLSLHRSQRTVKATRTGGQSVEGTSHGRGRARTADLSRLKRDEWPDGSTCWGHQGAWRPLVRPSARSSVVSRSRSRATALAARAACELCDQAGVDAAHRRPRLRGRRPRHRTRRITDTSLPRDMIAGRLERRTARYRFARDPCVRRLLHARASEGEDRTRLRAGAVRVLRGRSGTRG